MPYYQPPCLRAMKWPTTNHWSGASIIPSLTVISNWIAPPQIPEPFDAKMFFVPMDTRTSPFHGFGHPTVLRWVVVDVVERGEVVPFASYLAIAEPIPPPPSHRFGATIQGERGPGMHATQRLADVSQLGAVDQQI